MAESSSVCRNLEISFAAYEVDQWLEALFDQRLFFSDNTVCLLDLFDRGVLGDFVRTRVAYELHLFIRETPMMGIARWAKQALITTEVEVDILRLYRHRLEQVCDLCEKHMDDPTKYGMGFLLECLRARIDSVPAPDEEIWNRIWEMSTHDFLD